MLNYVRVVICNRIDVISRKVSRVIKVIIRLVAGQKPPPAIMLVVGVLTIHEADASAVHCNFVRRKTVPALGRQRLYIGGIDCKSLAQGLLIFLYRDRLWIEIPAKSDP